MKTLRRRVADLESEIVTLKAFIQDIKCKEGDHLPGQRFIQPVSLGISCRG